MNFQILVPRNLENTYLTQIIFQGINYYSKIHNKLHFILAFKALPGLVLNYLYAHVPQLTLWHKLYVLVKGIYLWCQSATKKLLSVSSLLPLMFLSHLYSTHCEFQIHVYSVCLYLEDRLKEQPLLEYEAHVVQELKKTWDSQAAAFNVSAWRSSHHLYFCFISQGKPHDKANVKGCRNSIPSHNGTVINQKHFYNVLPWFSLKWPWSPSPSQIAFFLFVSIFPQSNLNLQNLASVLLHLGNLFFPSSLLIPFAHSKTHFLLLFMYVMQLNNWPKNL